MKKVCKLLAMSLFFLSQAFAQGGGQAAITGTVVDPTGAAIPGAKVSVTQKGTSAHRVVVTDASGAFNVPSLLPATYAVAVQAPGFKSYSADVTILADQLRSVEVRMAVGQANEQVTVEESMVHVDTVTPVLNHVVEQARVVDLPLNGRNAADLTLLVPGTINANGHGVQQGDTKQVPGAESIAVNGARPDQISYNLDGANNRT